MIMDDFFELRVAFYKFVDRMSRRSSRKTEKITDIRLAGSERTCPYSLLGAKCRHNLREPIT